MLGEYIVSELHMWFNVDLKDGLKCLSWSAEVPPEILEKYL